ncbi:MAG: hypothetical protein KJ592_01775 [Nanoarchaeota archaeon]|nr:hypothetical protein [Nanoarchaeota archaeon]
MEAKIKGVLWGVFAAIIVILINWSVLALLNYPMMAIDIINQYWYLLVLLIGGFGLQVGLFVYYNSLSAIGCGTTVVSGGISGVSMILCCSHYILNLLPFLGAVVGMSSLVALSRYTPHFLWLGVVSNVIGIWVLYYQRNKYSKGRR